jgi:hypothetical protein
MDWINVQYSEQLCVSYSWYSPECKGKVKLFKGLINKYAIEVQYMENWW